MDFEVIATMKDLIQERSGYHGELGNVETRACGFSWCVDGVGDEVVK